MAAEQWLPALENANGVTGCKIGQKSLLGSEEGWGDINKVD